MDDDLAGLVKDDTRDKMAKAIEHVRHEMSNVRTGRASSALLEPLMVDYYGTPTPLRQLAGFSVPDAMLLARIKKQFPNAEPCKLESERV